MRVGVACKRMADGTAIDKTRIREECFRAMTTTHHTMKRLKGFDYTKPYFYMVTLKRVKGLKPFGEITKEAEPPKDVQGRPRYLIANEISEGLPR